MSKDDQDIAGIYWDSESDDDTAGYKDDVLFLTVTNATAAVNFATATTLASTVATTGVHTPTGGVAAAGGFSAFPGGVCHTGGLPASVSTDFTNAAQVVTETYYCEVYVPCNMTITGISFLNGSNVTGNRHAALLTSTGALVAGAVTGSVAGSGTDAYQNVPFTAPITVLGPATYFVAEIFNDSGSGKYNAHVIGNFRCGKVTGQTFGAIVAITNPASTFTTNLGPVASLY